VNNQPNEDISFSLLASVLQGKFFIEGYETYIHFFQSFSSRHHIVRTGGVREG